MATHLIDILPWFALMQGLGGAAPNQLSLPPRTVLLLHLLDGFLLLRSSNTSRSLGSWPGCSKARLGLPLWRLRFGLRAYPVPMGLCEISATRRPIRRRPFWRLRFRVRTRSVSMLLRGRNGKRWCTRQRPATYADMTTGVFWHGCLKGNRRRRALGSVKEHLPQDREDGPVLGVRLVIYREMHCPNDVQ